MERVIRKFKTFADAEAADIEFYSSLTPQQRLDMVVQLLEMGNDGTESRFERVCRVVKFDER